MIKKTVFGSYFKKCQMGSPLFELLMGENPRTTDYKKRGYSKIPENYVNIIAVYSLINDYFVFELTNREVTKDAN